MLDLLTLTDYFDAVAGRTAAARLAARAVAEEVGAMIGGEESGADVAGMLGFAAGAAAPTTTTDIAALRARRPGWFTHEGHA